MADQKTIDELEKNANHVKDTLLTYLEERGHIKKSVSLELKRNCAFILKRPSFFGKSKIKSEKAELILVKKEIVSPDVDAIPKNMPKLTRLRKSKK